MPNRKISQLPQTSLPTTLEDTDRLPLARSGSTYHILGSDIKSPILSQAQSTMLTKVNSLSARDTDTIDLSFSSTSYVLSASVRDESISTQQLSAGAVTTDKIASEAVTTDKIASEAVRYSQLASWQSLSASPTLSAEAVTQRLPKAWVYFKASSPPAITDIKSWNIISVAAVTSPYYDITVPFNITNAPVFVTSGLYSGLYSTYATIVSRTSNTVRLVFSTGSAAFQSNDEINVIFY